MRLGVIADDFTGATDIAGFLQEYGMATVLYNTLNQPEVPSWVDAIIISLKIRSCVPHVAISEALAALEFLMNAGCDRFYYKYCSTFDSTPQGNIGPVGDALMQRLNVSTTIVCPALPVNGRTVYQGYLFVGSELLSDSPMRFHPLNPMTDSKLSRLLGSQTKKTCAHIFHADIKQGAEHIAAKLSQLKNEGAAYVILDTLDDSDLDVIARATETMKFVTGGSGLAIAIAKGHRHATEHPVHQLAPVDGPTVILSGSCSERTKEQLAYYKGKGPMFRLDAKRCMGDTRYPDEVITWILNHGSQKLAPLVFAIKEEMDGDNDADKNIGTAIEHVFATITDALVRHKIRTFIVAGGETSGAVAKALHLDAYVIGPFIDPGVPWIYSLDTTFQLALKSGNFGSIDFFVKAQTFSHDNQARKVTLPMT